MERTCIACGGSGRAEHVDRTLPPPPCRLCHPEEAALHTALARETRTIVAARRLDAYQTLRATIMLGDVVPPAATPALVTTNHVTSRARHGRQRLDMREHVVCVWDRRIHLHDHQGHATGLVTTKLHEADIDVGVAQELAHRPDDTGPVVVARDQPLARGEGEIQPVVVDGEEVSRVPPH